MENLQTVQQDAAPDGAQTQIADVFAELDAEPAEQTAPLAAQPDTAEIVDPVFVPLTDLTANATFGVVECNTVAESKVYEQPAQESPVLATLPVGVAVTRYSQTQAWSLVVFGETKLFGWVAMAGLKANEP